VSDPAAYEAALTIYDNRQRQFPSGDQQSFWNIRVEEAIASSLSTGYLRPHSQGLGNKTSRGGCLLADKSSYFPFRRMDDSIPGFYFRVNIYGAPGSRRPDYLVPGYFDTSFQDIWQEMLRKKTEVTQQYLPKTSVRV
jgi:hypothetical protein